MRVASASPAPCVAGELETADGGSDGASSYVKGRRQLVGRCRSTEQKHRHARQVAPIQSENLRRDIVEGGRFVLKAHHLAPDQFDHLVAR